MEMTGKWVSIGEASAALGVSPSTVRRRIEAGEIESKTEVKRRLVWIANELQVSSKDDALVVQLQRENEYLKKKLDEITAKYEESRERQDTIILQLTRQLDQNQRLLEYHREPFWRRWFSKREESRTEDFS